MLSNHPNCLGGNGPSASSDLIGDVDGPASATDNAVARFDGTTGKLIQNSVVTIADTTGAIAGATSLTSPASTNLTLGLGTGGTALTLASSTLAATFAGSITAAGAGSFTTADATQTFRIKGATGMLRVAGYVDATNGAVLYSLNNAENAYIPLSVNSSEIYLNIAGTPKLSIGTTGTVSIASTTSASSSTAGAFLVGNGTAATNVAIGGGKVNIGDTTAGASNAGALVVAGGLSAGNNGNASYFGGDVTLSKATPALNLVNTSASTFAQFLAQSTVNRSIIVGQYGDSSAGTTLGIANAAGALIATATTGANYPDKLVITTIGRPAPIYFGTNNTLALTLDGTTQAATFAGAVAAASAAPEIVMLASGGNQICRFSDTTGAVNNRNRQLTSNNSANGDFLLMRSLTTGANAGTVALGFDRDGAATFAGAVSVNGTGTFGSSFGKVIINQWSDATNYGAITLNGNTTVAGSLGIGGGASGDSTLYFNAPTGGSIQARINGTAALTIASTSAATFAGAVTIAGNVGFYNASPVAKPTGVAVTAAAIHAALVTLNLIAA